MFETEGQRRPAWYALLTMGLIAVGLGLLCEFAHPAERENPCHCTWVCAHGEIDPSQCRQVCDTEDCQANLKNDDPLARTAARCGNGWYASIDGCNCCRKSTDNTETCTTLFCESVPIPVVHESSGPAEGMNVDPD